MSRIGVFGALLLLCCAGCVSSPPQEQVEPSPKELAAQAYRSGLELMAERRHELALVRLYESVSLDPLRADAHYHAGLCYYELGDYEREAAEYGKSLAISPNQPRVWRALGLSRVSVDDLEGARGAYQRASELEPLARVLYNLALVEADLGNVNEARRLLERCVSEGEAHLRQRAQQSLSRLGSHGG